MKRINVTLFFSSSYLLLFLFNVCIGYPMERGERNALNKLLPHEIVYPNGSVAGKYSYVDKEGNPVEVKYYADDSSYGVELNSVKMFIGKESKEKAATDKSKKEQDQVDYADSYKYEVDSTGKKYEMDSDDEPQPTNKADTTYDKRETRNPDYDIYKPNDVGANVNCGAKKEKVYVYNFDPNQRKAFRAPEPAEDEPQHFCQLY